MTFFLTAVFMLLVFWRPQEWLIPWLFGFPLLRFIYGVSILSLMVEIQEGRLRIPATKPPQYLLLLGLFIGALMSHASWFYLAGLLATIEPVSRLLVFAALLLAVLDRPGRLRWIAWIVVVMAAVMAAHCILQQRRGYGFAYAWPMYIPPAAGRPGYTRSFFFGIFEDPNDTAQILATSIPFAFVLFRRRGLLPFLIGVAITWLLVTGFMTTHSRGGLVAMAGVGIFMAALLLPERLIPWVLGIMAVGGLLATPLSAVWLETTPYTYERIDFWAQANWAFKAKPIFGIGYGMMGDIIGGRASHNAFVSAYTELGLFGYWFWFGLVLLGFMGCWRARTALARVAGLEGADAEEALYLKRFAGMAMAGMVGFMSSSYFLSRAFIFPLFIFVAILGAVPSVAAQYMPEDTPPFITFKDWALWGGIGSAASVLYVYFSIVLVNKVYFG